MHIPDGYLSPATCVVLYGAAMPFWYRAAQRVKQAMSTRMVPMLSLFAAFVFVIQMFNIPVPGGTTAHAVGGTLVAIVLGPWAAVLGVSIALAIQAFFFGDGGITAIGANSFNLAVALPLTGYAAYRIISGSSPSPRRRTIAAGIGGYVGINVASLLAAVELGLQPLYWSEGGRALYNPYGLDVTVPTMLATHLTIAGFAEAAVTALVVAYLPRVSPGLFEEGALTANRGLGRTGWLLAAGLAALSVLAPLGLLAPGDAEFEWGAEELAGRIGYVPAGLQSLGDFWSAAPLRGYQVPWVGDGGNFGDQALGYALSALVGIGLIALAIAGTNAMRGRGGIGSGVGRQSGRADRGASSSRGSNFLGKNVSGITRSLESALFSEEQARIGGFLQQIDPRVKLLTLLALIVVTGLSRHLVVIAGVYLVTLGLAVASRLPLDSFLKRTLLGIPLFAGLVVLPSLFIVPGNQLVAVQVTEGIRLGVSDNGLSGAILVISRVGVSVSLAALLVLTTRWADLLKSLQALHLPQAFVLVLGMTYRYLFLLLKLTNDMFLARVSRTVGQPTGGQNLRWVAATGGALVGKSLKMSEDVYLAMLARGFAGEVRTINTFKTRDLDWLFVGAVLVVAVSALLIDGGLR